MNQFERDLFKKLAEDRSKDADRLERPSMSGVRRSSTEKYSDQAHFIYELLQNADDVKATKVEFHLTEKGLLFKHTGTNHFTISDVDTEKEDGENHRLGHINAITSFGHSNKTEASIGKYGIGFKAVFHYTNTPHIYDPKFRFKIVRLIVPELLKEDWKGRKQSETVFYFPFDRKELSSTNAYQDILKKLKSLVYPTLFLKNLMEIVWIANRESGYYTKAIKKEVSISYTEKKRKAKEKGNISCQLIHLEGGIQQGESSKRLWLFTRLERSRQHYISVGFFLNADGNKLEPERNRSAFCFFSTKKETKLNFIIHAPFLLTDSREGIIAGEEWNTGLIDQLAQLAADSLFILKNISDEISLIDDDMMRHIIPYRESEFTDINDTTEISFKPFYTRIKEKLQTEELLPAKNGKYSSKPFAFWASNKELSDLFSDNQLAKLTETSGAKWVFVSIAPGENPELKSYIDREAGLIQESLSPENLLKKISAEFIKNQDFSWLRKLYKYLLERETYQKIIKKYPIFIDTNGEAVAAFDDKDNLTLFLPTGEEDGYNTIHGEFLKDEDSKKFFNLIGITQPSLRDEIYNKILPRYNDAGGDDIILLKNFPKLLKYYKEYDGEEREKFIIRLKKEAIIFYKVESKNEYQRHRGKPSEDSFYMPTIELKKYFKTKPDTRFVDMDFYHEVIPDDPCLDEFFEELEVYKVPKVIRNKITDKQKINQLPVRKITQPWRQTQEYYDKIIDGCSELLENINKELSICLWEQLILLEKKHHPNFEKIIDGVFKYPCYGKPKEDFFPSTAEKLLKQTSWLYKGEDNVAPKDITAAELSVNGYKIDTPEARELIHFLQIKNIESVPLSEEQRNKYELGEKVVQYGLTKEDLEEARRRKYQNNNSSSHLGLIPEDRSVGVVSKSTDGFENFRYYSFVPSSHGEEKEVEEIKEEDEDEQTKPSVDFEKKREQKERWLRKEIEVLHDIENLNNIVRKNEKYSFAWFKALLNLEYLQSCENNNNGKKINIQFDKIEKETEQILVLKHPNRYIPSSIEDVGNISMELHFKQGSPSTFIPVEVVSVKEFTLRAKLKSTANIAGIDLSSVSQIIININDPIFILKELQKRFDALSFEADFNLRDNLTPNIRFVFGPPGTGKTTHLAGKELIPLMQKEKIKVLVLTPTNKAADILMKRIMEEMGNDDSYQNWLIRFGCTADKDIEQSPVLADKTFDLNAIEKEIVVTTIARFSYDHYQPEEAEPVYLRDLDWDYIVVDEASMIMVAAILYPLYYKQKTQFIIAGDPFQIEPIVSVKEWKNENIYTLVGLNNFATPHHTVPHIYEVTHLSTQYRSIPAVGEIFNQFAYGGILKHHRKPETRKALSIDELEVRVLNIIKFSVSKYESVYRAKRLNKSSPYQIYSAIFSFEFVRYLCGQIAKKQEDSYKIGIICPYKAQATLIDRLFASQPFKTTNIEIQVGTIHGFQGDECDIVVVVFNPPPEISKSPEMFLNKRNVLNVAISRARDYLFLLTPNEDTEDITNLTELGEIEKLVKRGGDKHCKVFYAEDVEETMFHRKGFIEENTFSTTHQPVNVYSMTEGQKRYEVRCGDTTVDILVSQK